MLTHQRCVFHCEMSFPMTIYCSDVVLAVQKRSAPLSQSALTTSVINFFVTFSFAWAGCETCCAPCSSDSCMVLADLWDMLTLQLQPGDILKCSLGNREILNSICEAIIFASPLNSPSLHLQSRWHDFSMVPFKFLLSVSKLFHFSFPGDSYRSQTHANHIWRCY